MKDIVGNVVVVTGASKGIGEAIAHQFANAGCRLVLCGRNKTRLNKVAKATGLTKNDITTVSSDISKESGMKKIIDTAYKKFNQVDIFINNAGVGVRKEIHKCTLKEYDYTFDTNLKAVYFSFRMLLPRMIKRKSGQIINISSGAGRIGLPGMALYSASKAALNAMCEAAAGEVRNHNIKINTLAPGSTDTNFGGQRLQKKTGKPTGKIKLTPEEVAEAVVHLARQNENAFTQYADIRPLITKRN